MAKQELIQPMFNEGGASGEGWSEMVAMRCEKEYQLAKVRGIYQPKTQTPAPLAGGTFVHAGRARWFAEKQSTSMETWAKIVADVDKARAELELPTAERVYKDALRWLTEYVEFWSVRPAPNIVAVEHFLGPMKVDGDDTSRTARLDDFGFYEEAGGLAVGECKTAMSLQGCITEYTLHGQPTLQQILWAAAPQGEATYGPIKGTVLDIVEKGYAGKKCNFARVFLPLNANVILWAKKVISETLRRRSQITWETDAKRGGLLSGCTKLLGGARIPCEFQNLCMFGEAAVHEYAFRDGRNLLESTNAVKPWE